MPTSGPHRDHKHFTANDLSEALDDCTSSASKSGGPVQTLQASDQLPRKQRKTHHDTPGFDGQSQHSCGSQDSGDQHAAPSRPRPPIAVSTSSPSLPSSTLPSTLDPALLRHPAALPQVAEARQNAVTDKEHELVHDEAAEPQSLKSLQAPAWPSSKQQSPRPSASSSWPTNSMPPSQQPLDAAPAGPLVSSPHQVEKQKSITGVNYRWHGRTVTMPSATNHVASLEATPHINAASLVQWMRRCGFRSERGQQLEPDLLHMPVWNDGSFEGKERMDLVAFQTALYIHACCFKAKCIGLKQIWAHQVPTAPQIEALELCLPQGGWNKLSRSQNLTTEVQCSPLISGGPAIA